MDWKNKAKWLLGSRTIHLDGDGQFAFVTPCRNRAFSLWATRAEAEQAMNSSMPCGGECLGVTSHYIVDLGKPSWSLTPSTVPLASPMERNLKEEPRCSDIAH